MKVSAVSIKVPSKVPEGFFLLRGPLRVAEGFL